MQIYVLISWDQDCFSEVWLDLWPGHPVLFHLELKCLPVCMFASHFVHENCLHNGGFIEGNMRKFPKPNWRQKVDAFAFIIINEFLG